MPNIAYAAIFINEFLPNSVNKDYEWIEIYNNSPGQFDLSGWYLDDDAAEDTLGKSAYLLPAPLSTLISDEKSPLADCYPEDFKIDLAGKRQKWEAVVLLPPSRD